MKWISRLVITGVCSLVYMNPSLATSIPNTDNPKTFLGPTLHLGFTNNLGDYTAYSIAGEAGIKNFRASATLGWTLTDYQRFKMTAEYLWQDITYAFFSGNEDQWMSQGALGAAYQYDFAENSYRPQFDLTAYGSHAPSKSLSTVNGTYVTASGFMLPFTDLRHIAGSNAVGGMAGLAFMPWNGGRVSAGINYDAVRYDKDYSPSEDAFGFGGTVGYDQAITDTVGFSVSAAVRQPFNNYAANLSWTNVPYQGRWKVALFGDYNVGKNTLPDTYNVGLSADYFLDQRTPQVVPMDLKGHRNLKGEVGTFTRPISDGLLAWTAKPAVYMPQVLAVVDPSKQTCTIPVTYIGLSSTDLTNFLNDNFVVTYDFAPSFTGSPTAYSMTVDAILGSPTDLTINPQTGVLSGLDTAGGTYNVTVTATNGCSSASIFFSYNP